MWEQHLRCDVEAIEAWQSLAFIEVLALSASISSVGYLKLPGFDDRDLGIAPTGCCGYSKPPSVGATPSSRFRSREREVTTNGIEVKLS